MSWTKALRQRLENRSDSEHKQALLRIVIVLTGVIGFHYRHGWVPYNLNLQIGQTALTVLLSISTSLLIFGHIVVKPESNNIMRRIFGMVHDVSATTMFLHLGDETSAIYLFVYPFITIGNGFRFGVSHLVICSVLCLTGLGWLFTNNQYWRMQTNISLGLAVNFLMVSIYTAYLLNQLKKATSRLEQMATQDQLTGLANRRVFLERLDYSLINSINNRQMACLYLDLDGFKKVNDEVGHHIGDLLLQKVAERVKTCIRSNDLFARMGGDEFTIILESIDSRDEAEAIAKRIIQCIEGITHINEIKIKVSASVGCVLIAPLKAGKEMVSTPEVVTQADENMYKSKKAGKGTYTISEFKYAS